MCGHVKPRHDAVDKSVRLGQRPPSSHKESWRCRSAQFLRWHSACASSVSLRLEAQPGHLKPQSGGSCLAPRPRYWPKLFSHGHLKPQSGGSCARQGLVLTKARLSSRAVLTRRIGEPATYVGVRDTTDSCLLIAPISAGHMGGTH